MIQHFPLGAFIKAKSWLIHNLFKAPSSPLLLWKSTAWCLFLLHSNCETPFRGRSEIRHWYCSTTQEDYVHKQDSLSCLCLAMLSHRGVVVKVTLCLKCRSVGVSYILSFISLFPRPPKPHTASISSSRIQRWEKWMQHSWCIKWAMTLQHWCLLHTHTQIVLVWCFQLTCSQLLYGCCRELHCITSDLK